MSNNADTPERQGKKPKQEGNNMNASWEGEPVSTEHLLKLVQNAHRPVNADPDAEVEAWAQFIERDPTASQH